MDADDWKKLLSNSRHCPNCGSTNVTEQRAGFDGKRATFGFWTFGLLGSAFGMVGADDIKCHCLSCGYQYRIKGN